MTETLLGHLASGGGFALSWLWQATLIGTVAVICAAWLGPRRPLLAQGFLLAAFFRFALPPVSILSWAEQLPPLLSGPRQQGLELLLDRLQQPPRGVAHHARDLLALLTVQPRQLLPEQRPEDEGRHHHQPGVEVQALALTAARAP